MEALLPAILGAVASSVVGGLMAKKPSTPAAPGATPPTVMPDPMAQKAQQRRKAASLYGQQLTAENTILSGGDKLGG